MQIWRSQGCQLKALGAGLDLILVNDCGQSNYIDNIIYDIYKGDPQMERYGKTYENINPNDYINGLYLYLEGKRFMIKILGDHNKKRSNDLLLETWGIVNSTKDNPDGGGP